MVNDQIVDQGPIQVSDDEQISPKLRQEVTRACRSGTLEYSPAHRRATSGAGTIPSGD